MITTTPKFKTLDAMISFNYKSDLLNIIRSLGKRTVSSYVYDQYYNKKRSTRQIAKQLNMTQNTIVNWMNHWQMPRNSKGGNTVNQRLKNPKIIARLLSLKGKVHWTIAAKGICSPEYVRLLWRKTA